MGNTNYPGAIDTWVDLVDRVDDILAAHLNDAYARLIAIENTLGINPQGAWTTVANRMANLIGPIAPFATWGWYEPEVILDADPAPEYFSTVA